MNPDPSNPDRRADLDARSRRETACAAVTAVLMIEHSSAVSRDALVSLFLSTAWPTLRAQNQ
jgi:hypothetical protein